MSTDLEADGPVPGLYSMLSFASAAFDEQGELLDTFSANLHTLPEASTHPDTMRWWQGFPEAWQRARVGARPPEQVMPEYARWVRALPGRPVFVGYPVGFDFPFITYYLYRFAGDNPFGFGALDIKTYAMSLLGNPSFRETVKDALPAHWFAPGTAHTHIALDDALEQGYLFIRMRQERLATLSQLR